MLLSAYFTFQQHNKQQQQQHFLHKYFTQMEFSKYLGVADECSSSESGWTMYIVSPMHESNHHHHHDHDHDNHGHGHDDDDESQGDYYCKMHHNEDSDDSMVSDASSAPSRQRGSSKKRSGLRRESKHALNQKHVEKKLHDRRQRAVKVKEEEHKTRVDAKAKKT